MKNLLLILSISLTSLAAPSDSYTDLQSLSTSFAESLGGLIEKKEVLTAADVKSQISPLKRTRLELQAGAGKALAPDVLYRDALKSVVLVGRAYKCGRCSHWHENSAGGFVIHPDGYIATNYHVVEGAAEKEGEGLGVRLPDGRVLPVKRIVATDQLNDLAVIQVEAAGLTPLRIADDIDIGDPVYVLSHPVGVFNTFTEGMVSNKVTRPGRGKRKTHELNITADFAKGSSGCPVLNNAGELIGMVRSTRSTYYDEHGGVETNLQMVWKEAIPSFLLRELCSGTTRETAVFETSRESDRPGRK